GGVLHAGDPASRRVQDRGSHPRRQRHRARHLLVDLGRAAHRRVGLVPGRAAGRRGPAVLDGLDGSPLRHRSSHRDESAARLMLIIAILAIPLVMTIVAASFSWRPFIGWASAASSAAILVLGIGLSVATLTSPQWALLHSFRADSLSAFMVVVIGTVALLATLFTPRTMQQELSSGVTTARYARHYVVLMQVFITCMLSAVLTANLGVLWISIEATTIATTFLVSHRRTDGAFGASWKYVILCSIGIALAFLGTVLIYYAQLHAGGPVHSSSLDW